VVVHCGLLPPRLRDLPGSRPLDLRLGDPLALVPVADRHPRLRLVVPRFGGGFLRETLLAGEAAPNILVDSSSDHSWLRTQPAELRLEDLLERVLGVFGPERLLFATGSSILPRGWRHERFTHQREALGALGVGAADQAAIFRDNARRLLDL
jgi:predicted TIM-barrel fold metal-dependent hydrolase